MTREPDDGLRALFVRHLPHPRYLQPIEIGMTSCGTPDLNFIIEGVEGWIEMKSACHWEVSLRPGQIGDLETRARHGGRVFVAVRRRAAGADELWLLRGACAMSLRVGGLRWALEASEAETRPTEVRRGGAGGKNRAAGGPADERAGGDWPPGPAPLLGRWTGGPGRDGWDWGEVRSLLLDSV